MRIVYVNSLFGKNAIGGAEKITYMLARAMQDRGHEVFVISLHKEKTIEMEFVDGIKVIYLPLKNLYWISNRRQNGIAKALWHLIDMWNPLMLDSMRLLLKAIKPNVIHYHNISGFSGSIIRASRSRKVITLHDYYFKCYRSAMFRNGKICNGQCLDCKLLTLPRKIVSSEIDFAVSVSEFLREEVCSEGYFTNSKKITIKNVVNGLEFSRGKSEDKRKIRFGYIGRLSEEKGFSNLINVFESISHDRDDYELIIAGDGELLDLINQRDSRILYKGVVDPSEFFGEIDVLIVPSIWNDPYPTVILESHSMGIPVLGRRRGGITELLIEHGEHWLFDSDQEMKEKIVNILERRDTLKKVFSNNVGVHNWASRYEEIYRV